MNVAEQVVEGLRAGAASAFAETERLVDSARSRTLAEQLDEEPPPSPV